MKVSGVKEGWSCPAGGREERALANLSIVPDGGGCGARRTLLVQGPGRCCGVFDFGASPGPVEGFVRVILLVRVAQ